MPANVSWKHQLRNWLLNSHFTWKFGNIHVCCNSMVGGGGLTLRKRQLIWLEDVRWADPHWQEAEKSLRGKKFLYKTGPLKLSSHAVLKLEPAPSQVGWYQASAPGWHHTHPPLLTPPPDRLDPTFLRSTELGRERCQQAPSTGATTSYNW